MNAAGIDLLSLALLGFEWARPLGLLALLLPLALALLLRRRERPRSVATGTLAIWEAVGEERRAESTRTRRGLPPRARVLCVALALGALAIAGPRREAPPLGGRWRVVVDRSPSMYLPLEVGGRKTRYEEALAVGLAELAAGGNASWDRDWITPGEEAHRGPKPPAAWSAPPRWVREEPRWEGWCGPGFLWLTDLVPEVPREGASLVASGGAAAPGLVAHLGGRELLWDGARLVEGSSAPAGRVGVRAEPPAVLRKLLEIWAGERGLELAAGVSLEDREVRLVLSGTPGPGGARMRAGRDGWGIEGRIVGDGAPLEDAWGPLETWLTSPDGARRLVGCGPGRVQVALADLGPPAGDPALFAVSWAELFDRTALGPRGAVSVRERAAAGEPGRIPGEPPVEEAGVVDNQGVSIEAWLALAALALAALAWFSQLPARSSR